MRGTILPVVLACMLVGIGCSKKSPTSPGTNPGGTTAGKSLSASIDGTAWTASTGVYGNYQSNILSVGGSNLNSSITLGFAVGRGDGGPLSPGTYTFSLLQGHNATLYVVVGSTTQGWSGGPTSGSGTITITRLSSAGAAGTFSFSLPALTATGATGTKNISNGTFDLTF